MAYVDFLHAQKQMFADFVKSIVEPTTEKARPQPTAMDIRSAILRFPGRRVTYQAFKKYSPRSLRSIQRQEFQQSAETLSEFGTAVQIRIPRQARKMAVFLKKSGHDIL